MRINTLQHDELSDINYSEIVGKQILGTRLDDNDNVVLLVLEGGYSLTLSDDGQSCCETRYITCDDNLSDLIGSKFSHIKELKHTTVDDDEYENEHEIVFVEIRAEDTFCTICTHNEHNGYYGGFNLNVRITKKE